MQTEDKTISRRFFGNIDWMLLAALGWLLGIGLLGVYSATLHYGHGTKFIVTQVMAMVMGMVGMLVLSGFNYQFFRPLIYPIYAASLALLGSVLVFGSTVHGTKGWFKLGLFSFQPVEVAKLMFIVVLAGFMDSRWRETKRLSTLVQAMLLLSGQLMLIMMQPDFSSTLSYFPVTLVLLFIAGVEPVYLLGIMIFGAISAGIPLMSTFFRMQPDLLKAHQVLQFFVTAAAGGWKAFLVIGVAVFLIFLIWWFLVKFRVQISFIYPLILALIVVAGSLGSVVVDKSLKEYQRKRLIVFLSPEIDPLGSGYNIIQSKIAIGSGKLFGKGLFSGTQTQLGFLPEQHTDFIFAVVGEETGYVFSQITILMYLLLVWRAMVVAREARDRFGSLIATGLATMFAFYAIINIGMVMGMMPATGLPLLLLSYGGSSMVTSLWAIGLLLSINIRRFTH